MDTTHLIKKEYRKPQGFIPESVKVGNSNQIIRILAQRNKEENKTCFAIDRRIDQRGNRKNKR